MPRCVVCDVGRDKSVDRVGRGNVEEQLSRPFWRICYADNSNEHSLLGLVVVDAV